MRHSRRAIRSAILESVQIAQPENCSPLAVAFAAGLSACADGDWKPTVAEGASITRPVRDREVLAAVASSGGDFQTVPEDEIPRAVLSLAANGLYTEPTSSIVAAAIPGFIARGLLRAGETAVMVLTGSGLKAASTMADIARDPTPTDQPEAPVAVCTRRPATVTQPGAGSPVVPL